MMKMIHIVILKINTLQTIMAIIVDHAWPLKQLQNQNRVEESKPVQKNILRGAGIPESQVVANKNPVRVSFGGDSREKCLHRAK
jgi:hypothetical protein